MRLLREPLLHFLVLGALLFALFTWVNDDTAVEGEIVVDRARGESLARQFERSWRRPPTRAELEGLVETWIREEVFYRAGTDSGLQREDEVVRRRVSQQMTAMVEGMAADVPTDAELEAWLRARAADYRMPARYTLRQFFFDPSRHGARLDALLADARTTLARDPSALVGDATQLPERLDDVTEEEAGRVLGHQFAAALSTLPDGRWSGPVASSFGVHLVVIDARTLPREASLPEVRQAVERDLLGERSRQAREKFYEGMRVRYAIRIDPDAYAAAGDTSVLADAAAAGAGSVTP